MLSVELDLTYWEGIDPARLFLQRLHLCPGPQSTLDGRVHVPTTLKHCIHDRLITVGMSPRIPHLYLSEHLNNECHIALIRSWPILEPHLVKLGVLCLELCDLVHQTLE